MEVHWDNCSFDSVFCICITVVVTFLIVLFCVRMILEHKKKIVELSHSHEKEMKEKEWERKKEWEDKISLKNDSQKKSEGGQVEKEDESKEKKIKELEEQLKKTTQLDLERMALLVYFSSNGREYWTTEKATKLIEQVKSTQEAIKKYLEFKS